MGKTRRDKPSKEHDIQLKKLERGDHRRMDPYNRAHEKQSYRRDD